jgi:hypothetical protein
MACVSADKNKMYMDFLIFSIVLHDNEKSSFRMLQFNSCMAKRNKNVTKLLATVPKIISYAYTMSLLTKDWQLIVSGMVKKIYLNFDINVVTVLSRIIAFRK